MPLVFSAITPHTPLLVPNIGKENIERLSKTRYSLHYLEKNLYSAKPESLIIISPHGPVLDNAFTINLCDKYIGRLEEFGDHSTQIDLKGDYNSIQQIRAGYEASELCDVPFTLSSFPDVDYAVSVPLLYLMNHQKNLPIIPVYYSLLDPKTCYNFGVLLRKKLNRIEKRFAVVASADLSHKLLKRSPTGYSKHGDVFDKAILEFLEKKDVDALFSIDPIVLKKSGQCGFNAILIMLGILGETDYTVDILSYEHPFGVGYLTAEMKIL